MAVVLGLALLITGCMVADRDGDPIMPVATGGTPPVGPSPTCSPWGCAFAQRFPAAEAFIKGKPGYLGIVVSDRTTGEVWRAGAADRQVWTASTVKLAMSLQLLERDRAGEVSLSASDRGLIADMLLFSSDDAATTLWNRYGKSAMVATWRGTYGMTKLTFVDGFSKFWGFMKCTAEDLHALMSYLLDKADPQIRAYLVTKMREVDPVQQWGVWGAGPDWKPGNKDGWSVESDPGGKHWVTNSVGFAGDDERYVVSVMYQLPPGIGAVKGGQTISDLVATVFGGPVPAKVTVPSQE